MLYGNLSPWTKAQDDVSACRGVLKELEQDDGFLEEKDRSQKNDGGKGKDVKTF